MALKFLSPIHKATRQIEIYLEQLPTGRELSLREAHLITYVSAYGPCQVGELHRIFGFRRSTLTSMLDRLEKRRLITRRLHPQDRRSFLIQVTPAGKRMSVKIERDLIALEKEITAQLSKRDQDGFNNVMQAIGKTTEIDLKRKDKHNG